MNYYSHHIGDFNNATRHLTRIERSVYSDMIDLYYDTELPLSLDIKVLCRKLLARSDEESAAVQQVLNEFFTETNQGWHHSRCEQEISDYHTNISAKSLAGKASAAKREEERLKRLAELNNNPTDVQHLLDSVDGSVQQTVNHEPITNNQDKDKAQAPVRKKSQKTRISDSFAISDRVKIWSAGKRYGDLDRHFENFVSTAKAKGYEYLDWDEALMKAVRDNWAKIAIPPPTSSNPMNDFIRAKM